MTKIVKMVKKMVKNQFFVISISPTSGGVRGCDHVRYKALDPLFPNVHGCSRDHVYGARNKHDPLQSVPGRPKHDPSAINMIPWT